MLPLEQIERSDQLFEISLPDDELGQTPEGLGSSDSSVSLDDLDDKGTQRSLKMNDGESTPGFAHRSLASCTSIGQSGLLRTHTFGDFGKKDKSVS